MNRKLVITALSALLLSDHAPELASPGDPAEQAQRRITEMVRDGEVPGIQYVVVTRDRVWLKVAAGVRDVSTGAPMEHDTLQMAYSTTKAITALAAMQLVEAGRMDLDRPLDTYYPAHPYGRGVTLRSLLAQTSGVPNPMPMDWFSLQGEPLDRDAKLRGVLATHPELDHPAGSEYGYSNLSYWLLEKAIEAASGEDFERHLSRSVMAPVAVGPREALFAPGAGDPVATGHSPRYSLQNLLLFAMAPSAYWDIPRGRWSRIAHLQPHGRGYGGLFTSASALAAVLQDLLRDEPTLMTKETRASMFTRQTTSAGEPIDMTLGWVTGQLRGARYFGKQGGGIGFHGNLRVYPDQGVATVLLANRTEVTAGPIDARSDRLDAPFVSAPGPSARR